MNDQFKLVGGGNFIEFRPSGDDFKTAAERSEKMGYLQILIPEGLAV